MPKILITGNGFDLKIGLPTSYSDFLTILTIIESGEPFDFISIYSKCSTASLIETEYKQSSIPEREISQLRDLLVSNQWFKFFKTEFEIETWIDFENKIEYVLEKIFASLIYIKESVFSKGPLLNCKEMYSPNALKNNVELIEVLNAFKIIKKSNGNYFVLNELFLFKKYNYFIDVDVKKVTNNLLDELHNFKTIFNLYFEIFVIPLINLKKRRVDIDKFNDISKHFTFNYTPTFEILYKQNITSYLHGKINSFTNEIVLGINEIPINEYGDKRNFLPFTKYFQKLNNATDFSFLNEFEKHLSDNYVFFLWGHSLDKADKDYINEIFDFYNRLTSQTKKIIVVFHSVQGKSNLLLNLLNIRGKAEVEKMMRRKHLTFINQDSDELLNELEINISRRPLLL